MKMKAGFLATSGLAVCLALGSTPALAATIDFTNSAAWSGANGLASYSSATLYDGVSVTLSTNTGTLTFNAGDIHAGCFATTGLSCQGDGIGIASVGDADEVSFGVVGTSYERLTVTFSDAVVFDRFGFLDVYYEGGDDTSPELVMWIYAVGPSGDTLLAPVANFNNTDPGWAVTNLLSAGPFTSATFFAVGPDAPANTDFALAMIEFSQVPEPGLLLLLGAGLVGLAARARRQQRS